MDISPGDDARDDAFDEQAASPWANWTDDQPVIARRGAPTDSGKARDDNAHGLAHRTVDPLGTPGRGDRAGSSVVGCVVVVDVVCAGAAVPEGATLLAGLVERLTERIPAGARMRLDEGDSTLSVVMPGQEQPVAADWMHRTVGGLAPLEPGYSRVLVAPRPGGGLTHARSALDTRHGRVEVGWHVDEGRLVIETTLPDGVSGVLRLPGQDDVELSSGTHTHQSDTENR